MQQLKSGLYYSHHIQFILTEPDLYINLVHLHDAND